MRSLLSRRGAVLLSALALVGGAAVMVAPNALAASAPRITVTSGPTVDGSSVTVGFTVNRQTKSVRSCTYTIDGGATNNGCDTSTTTGTKNPAAYSVTLNDLANGGYTFTVNVLLTDGGNASTATSFIVDVVNVPQCWDGSYTTSDGRLTGPINTNRNFTAYSSQDGTCTGVAYPFVTAVQASNVTDATSLCAQVVPNYAITPSPATNGYPAAPADYWLCA